MDQNLIETEVGYLSINEKRVQLGYFKDVQEAARAYDAAAIKYHEEFAQLNFPNALNVRDLRPR
jgi:hypothetical protein